MTADECIRLLGLQPHPEGGYYRETWRSPAATGQRASGTAIYYLLQPDRGSHWHRVDAAEIWQYSAGDPLELRVWAGDGTAVERHRLGAGTADGEEPQVVVPSGAWQAARPLGDWTLVGCIVSPAFDFAGFELAPQGWEPPAGAE